MKARPQQHQRLERVKAGKQTRFWEVSSDKIPSLKWVDDIPDESAPEIE